MSDEQSSKDNKARVFSIFSIVLTVATAIVQFLNREPAAKPAPVARVVAEAGEGEGEGE